MYVCALEMSWHVSESNAPIRCRFGTLARTWQNRSRRRAIERAAFGGILLTYLTYLQLVTTPSHPQQKCTNDWTPLSAEQAAGGNSYVLWYHVPVLALKWLRFHFRRPGEPSTVQRRLNKGWGDLFLWCFPSGYPHVSEFTAKRN
ncbi:hypothetical protein F5X96DRAFT_629264 [Biscogniauxia mediterranea]|nr:hypothetical protein F5X96DRAFT_629264 [Biscogniauxia mediterranea]